MDLTPENFRQWLSSDISYLYSDQVPVESIYSSITKGPLAKYWKHIVRNVRSRSVAEHIRANLQLERHRRELLRSHNTTTNSTLGFDQTYEDDAGFGRDELLKELTKCERRLKRRQLEYATIEHETAACQASTLHLYRTLSSDEAVVRDKIRSALIIEREAEKYAGWIETMTAQATLLEAWTSYVYMDDLKGVKEINIVPVCKELKEKLAKVLTDRSRPGGATDIDDFSSLLDSLKKFPPSLCKIELASLLRDLAIRIEIASSPANGTSSDKSKASSRDQVKKSMLGLWRRHLESKAAAKKIEAEIEKYSEKTEKSTNILATILSDDDPLKDLLLHYFKLIHRVASAEALLANLQSQVSGLRLDSRSQAQTLGRIELDFMAVDSRSNVLERKRLLVETMLVQATGLGQRVDLFKKMISETRENIRSSFFVTSSSLTSLLAGNLNLPLSFLNSFDAAAFRPKVLLRSGPVPVEDLTIYRFSSEYQDLNEVRHILELLFPCNPQHVLEKLVELKNRFKTSQVRLQISRNHLESLAEAGRERSKSEQLEILLAKMRASSEQFMLAPSLTNVDTERWQTKLKQVSGDLDNWKTEPVKDIVQRDDRIRNNVQPFKPLAEWYKEFYLAK